jgi:hypothetical protein
MANCGELAAIAVTPHFPVFSQVLNCVLQSADLAFELAHVTFVSFLHQQHCNVLVVNGRAIKIAFLDPALLFAPGASRKNTRRAHGHVLMKRNFIVDCYVCMFIFSGGEREHKGRGK